MRVSRLNPLAAASVTLPQFMDQNFSHIMIQRTIKKPLQKLWEVFNLIEINLLEVIAQARLSSNFNVIDF